MWLALAILDNPHRRSLVDDLHIAHHHRTLVRPCSILPSSIRRPTSSPLPPSYQCVLLSLEHCNTPDGAKLAGLINTSIHASPIHPTQHVPSQPATRGTFSIPPLQLASLRPGPADIECVRIRYPTTERPPAPISRHRGRHHIRPRRRNAYRCPHHPHHLLVSEPNHTLRPRRHILLHQRPTWSFQALD